MCDLMCGLYRLQLSGAEKENAKKEALELSLKYSFVTPHTSMVVTKPPGENTQVLHKPKEGERSSPGLLALAPDYLDAGMDDSFDSIATYGMFKDYIGYVEHLMSTAVLILTANCDLVFVIF